MKYEAKLTDIEGGVAYFDFEADNNALASDHLAHVFGDKPMVQMTFEECGIEYTKVVKAEFRRYYAERWIKSVDIRHLQ